MEVKKAIKKMVALGTGLAMVGATIFGAAAVDLSEYPSPMFIDEGKFNGVIIFGDSAASSDVAGAVDIATSLQFAATVVTEVSGGSAVEPVISEGVKIDKSGDDFSFNNDIDGVLGATALDDTDLPEILPEGTYEDTEGETDNTETYSQELEFEPGTATLSFEQDDDDAPTAGDYLLIDKNEMLYTYTLEFDDAIDYTNTSTDTPAEDLESTTIEIQGRAYTIVDVEYDSSYDDIEKITLQVGETTAWIEEGVELTKIIGGVSHTVVLQDVNEDENKCGILIDGTLAWVDKDQTKTVNGVSIGVTDAIVVHSAGKDTDVCEVNLGAEEILLSDGDEIEINSAEIDGSDVTITASGGEWEKLEITFTPEDDVYLAAGDSWVDPVFGNFMIKYAGLTQKTEDFSLDVASDEAEFSFISVDGKEIEIPFFCDGGCDEATDSVYIGTGEDVDEFYYLEGDVCTSTSTPKAVTDCEGAIIIVSANREAHLIEIDDIDVNDDKITMKDVSYGGSTKETAYTVETNQSVSLPSGAGTLYLEINETAGTIEVLGGGNEYKAGENLETKYGAYLMFSGTNTTAITVSEEGDEDDDTYSQDIVIDMTIDTSDEELNIAKPAGTSVYEEQESDSNDDSTHLMTRYGTLFVWDNDDKLSLDITYPEEQVYGNVFVAPTSAIVSSGSAGGMLTTTTIQKIQVGAAKLASEVSDVTAVNAIVVGGPCANAAAATLMGNPEKCWEAVPQNKAILKLYENGDNVALLVAGSTALDTRRASRVLANFDDYDLTGMEVEVTGTSLTDISVSAPQ